MSTTTADIPSKIITPTSPSPSPSSSDSVKVEKVKIAACGDVDSDDDDDDMEQEEMFVEADGLAAEWGGPRRGGRYIVCVCVCLVYVSIVGSYCAICFTNYYLDYQNLHDMVIGKIGRAHV